MKEINYKKLPLVGEGCHGKVYRLDDKRCIKVCKDKKDMQMEYDVLKHASGYHQFPEVYECKDKYMIREFIDGVNIKDYIKKHGFNNKLAEELTQLLLVFMKLNFTKIDIRLHEVFVTNHEIIRIVDTTCYMTKKASYPKKMLANLSKLGCRGKYMEYLKSNYPELHKQWAHQVRQHS